MADEGRKPVGIDDIVNEEIKIITKRRNRLYPNRESTGCPRTSLVGLALSGGGIRSAVTSLGVLYEMSRVGLFNVVDYMSTVSGGGYIGGCIASLLSLKKPDTEQPSTKDLYTYDNGNNDPSLFSARWDSFPFRDLPLNEKKLQQDGTHANNSLSGYGADDPFCKEFSSRDQVFHLRNRASYLIPSALPFGSYVIRALGAVTASTLLSLLWFFSLIVMLTTVYMFITFSGWNTTEGATLHPPPNSPHDTNIVTLLAETTEEAAIHVSAAVTDSQSQQKENNSNSEITKKTDDGLISGIMKDASAELINIKERLSCQIEIFSTFTPDKWFALLFGILWGILAPSCMHWRGKRSKTRDIIGENLESYISRKQLKCISLATIGLLFTVFFAGILYCKFPLSYPDPRLLFPAVFAVGCMIGSLIMLCLLATGYLSWNRISRSEVALCTGIFIYCLIGSCLFAILPAFIMSSNSGFIAITLSLLILVMRFYFSGKKKGTETQKESGFTVFLNKVLRWFMGILVPVVVLLAIVGTATFLGPFFFGINWSPPVTSAEIILTPEFIPILSVLGISAFLSYILSIINFNNISPHVFYKDRLAEAFLVTLMRDKCHDKKAEDFATWMDLARNAVEMPLSDLHGHDRKKVSKSDCAARGPYLLINATLNLTAARDVKGFQRQSENFLFTRCYTGSERTGYLMTSEYNPPIELGRAMAISGAAVTSVMGTKGSLAESFACTILGVRLGYWLRNPIDMAARRNTKRWNWKNLYYELFRYTDSRDSHVYLSDGGHCGDNLGLLPLLQRRTKLIIASDAECDPEHIFDSLNNSIRRAYVDHNIKVHIDLADLMPDDKGLTKKHFAIGRILYPDRPWQKSWLLVIKNTINGTESQPLLNYKKKSPSFPHETTADQFFTEEQFEVYRSLGREACMEIWRDNIDIFRSEKWLNNPWACIDSFCEDLAEKKYKLNDVIREIWSSEKGDFITWHGFCETIRAYIREMVESALRDESVMVKQLHELDKWLQENKQQFPQLQGKYDIPRNWNQFKEIREYLQVPPEKSEENEPEI